MKLLRIVLVVVAVGTMAGIAYVAQQTESPGAKMAKAAERFIASLNADQKKKATFSFDDNERINWNFVPLQDRQRQPTRKGLGLYEMTKEQKDLALQLLAAGTSEPGKDKAVMIMTLESILAEVEKGGGSVRDPGWYFLTIFGTPGMTGNWGWRLEGHHLSLNYTVKNGEVVSATPCFFGANPAIIKNGPREGTAVLPNAEKLARQLFLSLNDQQKTLAKQERHFPEPEQKSKAPSAMDPVGLPASSMTDEQKKNLMQLIRAYADRMPAAVAEAQMKDVLEGGIEKIHFAWSGDPAPGRPHTYQVQGPRFVIRFLNTQSDGYGNPANHIHSVWRRVGGDFGAGVE